MSELSRKSVEEFKQSPKTPIIVVLDNIRSLNNIGSVFRTADAFLIESIYLCGITACPPHRDIHKTALGASETVDWKYFKFTMDAVRELRSLGFSVCAAEQTENSRLIQEVEISKQEKVALIFGNEVSGVDQKVLDEVDRCVEIPQSGTKHSLNVSVSVGILLWELYRKMMLE